MGRVIRFVDLCAGLGGLHRATELAQSTFPADMDITFRCVLASELDPNLREVYLSNFPDLAEGYQDLFPPGPVKKAGLDLYEGEDLARIHGDLRDLFQEEPNGRLVLRKWPRRSGLKGTLVPDHDLLLAGFPCQPFSKSGRQTGFEDEMRGTIFGLLEAIIREKKPPYVLLENVGNFERHDRGRTWEVVHSALRADYDVRATTTVSGTNPGLGLLSPHHFGYPHHRERFFIVAQRSDVVGCFPPGASPFPRNYRAYEDKERRLLLAEQRCESRLRQILLPSQLRLTRGETTEEEMAQAELTDTHLKCINIWNDLLKAVARFEGSPPRPGEELTLRPLPSFPIWGFELDPWNHYPFEPKSPARLSTRDLAHHVLTSMVPYATSSLGGPPDWIVHAADGWEWWGDAGPSSRDGEDLSQWLTTHLTRLDAAFLEPWRARWPAYAKREKWPRWKRMFLRQNRDFSDRLLRSLREPRYWCDTSYSGLSDWLAAMQRLPPSHQKLEWNCQGTEDLDLWKLILQFRPSGLRAKRFQHVPALVALTTTQVPIVPRAPGETKRHPDRPPSRFLLKAEALELQGFPGWWRLPSTKGAAFKALGNAVHAELVRDILISWLAPKTSTATTQLRLFGKNNHGETGKEAHPRSSTLDCARR